MLCISAVLEVPHLPSGNTSTKGHSLCPGHTFSLGEDVSYSEDSLSRVKWHVIKEIGKKLQVAFDRVQGVSTQNMAPGCILS